MGGGDEGGLAPRSPGVEVEEPLAFGVSVERKRKRGERRGRARQAGGWTV